MLHILANKFPEDSLEVREAPTRPLIDEFQDTDSAQGHFFANFDQRGAYLPDWDPKQAIYAFGAPTFVYLLPQKPLQMHSTH